MTRAEAFTTVMGLCDDIPYVQALRLSFAIVNLIEPWLEDDEWEKKRRAQC